jgi:hypothetical protein
VRNLDRKYAKKYLIREGAEDLMALRCKRITLDEHYARLYGPTMMVHQDMANNRYSTQSGGGGGGDSVPPPSYTEAERKQLKAALHNTPFERYRHNAYHNRNSPEKVRNDLMREQQGRNWPNFELGTRQSPKGSQGGDSPMSKWLALT